MNATHCWSNCPIVGGLLAANDGNANLHALTNAGGTSVDRVNLSAGKDLNVSVFKGSLYATGLQAAGQNINLLSNGITSVAHATSRNGSNTQAVASTLSAREDVTVGSINTAANANSQVQVVASSLNAGGQARVLSNGVVLLTAATDVVNGVTSPARSTITAGSVAIQGGTVQTDAADIRTNGDKTTKAKSGDISVAATSGNALFNIHTGFRSQFNSTGNIALHANGNLTHWYTQANAGGSLSSTSATGQVNGTGAQLVAKDVLSFASKGAQTHTSGFYSGGAASVFNETGHLALNSTRVQAVGTNTAGLGAVSGQASIESGGTLGLDAASILYAATDLSFVQSQGDITVNPTNAGRGTLTWSQIGANRNLTLATRNGNVNFTGSAGSNGVGTSSNVSLNVRGDLNLVGNNVNLQGSRLQTGGSLNITATQGSVNANALQVTQNAAGFTNYYWDYAQLIGTTGVNVRAAGDINFNTVWAQSNGNVNIQSGGNTTIAGNYARWTVDNRPSNGWFQDEKYLWQSVINGNTGVNLGALGGHLTLSSATVNAANGKASLQALGHINLEAGQEHKLHQASTTNTRWQWKGFKSGYVTETTYHHREYLTNKPVTIEAQDIEIKAGNNLNTFGTTLNASRNLRLEAGDGINYYAVYDQHDVTDTTYAKLSSWGLVTTSRSTTVNSTSKLTGQPTQLQSLGDILSNSGGNQLLQGTRVSYGGTPSFNGGVGDKARADARIILEGIRNTTTQTRTKESNYVVWQKQLNQGTREETLVLPSFTGPTKPSFTAPGGITVQIPAGEFRSQIATLSQQPGMSYLNELTARTDVNWQPVKLAYDSWNYQQEGLTPAGAALLAVAVAWALPPGVGANLIGATSKTTALMANAAFTSLAAQASISFINNKGDIGKTLKELGSSQTVKATIAAALTAGVLDKLGATDTMRELSAKTGFSDKLTYNLINASGRALTNTAINGGNLEDALRQALIGGLVDTAHGQAASQIKGLESQYLAHKLAHALAGCVAGAAAGGQCKDGAIGSAVGEIVAEMFKGQKPGVYASTADIDAYNQKVLGYSKLVAGAMSAYAGGNAQTAITTAETAVRNNFLTDKQWKEFSDKLAACKGNQACETQQRNEYLSISKTQDDALRAACTTPSSSACTTMTSQVLQGRQEQLNLYMSKSLPPMYVAGANLQGTGELIVKQATARLNADVARAERENFTGIINAGAYYGPGAEFALEYKDGKLVNVMWGFGVGVGLLARKQAGTGVEWNVFEGINSRPNMAPGEGRLALSAGFQGGLGPAAVNINAITAGLHSNSNGDKGFFESRGVVNAGVTPSFGVDAMGRVAITWQYQRKGAQQ